MKFETSPSHIAVLVPSVRKAADYLRQLNFHIGEEEVFETTREIYVQGDEKNPLLLMEPKGPGSYQRALDKRGPGVHHLAIDVLDIDGFLNSIAGSGWLLHLNSLQSLKNYRTAYLSRPGFPALIEVQEKEALQEGSLFVQKVSLNFAINHKGLVESVGLAQIVVPSAQNSEIVLHGQTIQLKDLWS